MTDEEYRNLFRRLRRFFEWNRCATPEDFAQESILRGLRRIEEGEIIYGDNSGSYFMGIARNVLREQWRKPDFEIVDENAAMGVGEMPAVQWRILLRECLDQLNARDRKLIQTYILEGVGPAARDFGISENAVRIRVSRIRERIASSLHGPTDYPK